MKTTTYTGIIALALAATLAGCSENAWNNQLDGFEEAIQQPMPNVQAIEYTLTDANYATIASLAANKELATDSLAQVALKEVGSKKCFSEAATAKAYVPAFLESSNFPYFTLTDGAAVNVTYNQAVEIPALYTAAQAVNSAVYTITDEQYELDIWGSDEWIPAFSPMMNVDNYIPTFLSDAINTDKNPVVLVQYRVANQMPDFTNGQPTLPMTTIYAPYEYSAGKWQKSAQVIALSPADYTAMGRYNPNLTVAEPYLSTYLKNTQTYAQAGDIRYVIWNQYKSSATSFVASAYKFDGTNWVPYNFTEKTSSQFVKNAGHWIFDPTVTITLPAGRNQPLSTLYFQTTTNWVFDNICKPLGDTNIKSGLFYVTSYGNNEYYAGTSAYQGNVDHRVSAARAQYPKAYESMTDEEVVTVMKKRFMEEVMPGALSILHPDAKPLEGLDVYYIINFAVYTGATTNYTAKFKVVAPGKFEPVSCTWDETAQ